MAGLRSGTVTNPAPIRSRVVRSRVGGPRLEGGSRTAEAPVTVVVNLIIFSAIALLPLGISFVFMRLRRKFSTYS